MGEDLTDDAEAPITEENIGEEEVEEVVGKGEIQLGDGVTAPFYLSKLFKPYFREGA